MTAIPSSMAARSPSPPSPAVDSARSSWQKWDDTLDWLSERLNPIVVKEARQALKSRQFTITFGLLLAFGACWTALGVAWNRETIFYSPAGPSLVIGYYIILAVPMLVIVPFVAFRSLAAEREDGTFDLLSIATLSARQVVVGKLASAVLQMMVYYSALAPCIAFTYLLRGLDIITIGLMLAYLFLASLLLSALGLALATITKERHWQVLLSVVLVAALVVIFGTWLSSMGLIFEAFLNYSPFDELHFWMGNVALLMFHASFLALFIYVSAGQITFATDNRSTPVRWVLFTQSALLFGWILYGMCVEPEPFFMMGCTFALIYWWVVGSFLIGERADLTPRVRRQLPQTFLGRMFLTWFNPGSGSGYFFALTNLGMILLAFYVATLLMDWWGLSMRNRSFLAIDHLPQFAVGAWLFAAAYLGLGRLIVLLVRRRVPNGVVFSFLLQIVLVTFGTLIPIVLQLSLFTTNDFNYSALQVTNPFWTLAEILFDYRSGLGQADTALPMALLAIFGSIMVLVHFISTIHEIEQTRLVAPQRVQEEDAAVIAARTPVRKRNPWDEPSAPASAS